MFVFQVSSNEYYPLEGYTVDKPIYFTGEHRKAYFRMMEKAISENIDVLQNGFNGFVETANAFSQEFKNILKKSGMGSLSAGEFYLKFIELCKEERQISVSLQNENLTNEEVDKLTSQYSLLIKVSNSYTSFNNHLVTMREESEKGNVPTIEVSADLGNDEKIPIWTPGSESGSYETGSNIESKVQEQKMTVYSDGTITMVQAMANIMETLSRVMVNEANAEVTDNISFSSDIEMMSRLLKDLKSNKTLLEDIPGESGEGKGVQIIQKAIDGITKYTDALGKPGTTPAELENIFFRDIKDPVKAYFEYVNTKYPNGQIKLNTAVFEEKGLLNKGSHWLPFIYAFFDVPDFIKGAAQDISDVGKIRSSTWAFGGYLLSSLALDIAFCTIGSPGARMQIKSGEQVTKEAVEQAVKEGIEQTIKEVTEKAGADAHNLSLRWLTETITNKTSPEIWESITKSSAKGKDKIAKMTESIYSRLTKTTTEKELEKIMEKEIRKALGEEAFNIQDIGKIIQSELKNLPDEHQKVIGEIIEKTGQKGFDERISLALKEAIQDYSSRTGQMFSKESGISAIRNGGADAIKDVLNNALKKIKESIKEDLKKTLTELEKTTATSNASDTKNFWYLSSLYFNKIDKRLVEKWLNPALEQTTRELKNEFAKGNRLKGTLKTIGLGTEQYAVGNYGIGFGLKGVALKAPYVLTGAVDLAVNYGKFSLWQAYDKSLAYLVGGYLKRDFDPLKSNLDWPLGGLKNPFFVGKDLKLSTDGEVESPTTKIIADEFNTGIVKTDKQSPPSSPEKKDSTDQNRPGNVISKLDKKTKDIWEKCTSDITDSSVLKIVTLVNNMPETDRKKIIDFILSKAQSLRTADGKQSEDLGPWVKTYLISMSNEVKDLTSLKQYYNARNTNDPIAISESKPKRLVA